MAMIEVNHSTLQDIAEAITTYCSAQDKAMREVDAEIKAMLSSEWLGLDAQEFGRKWEDVDASDSTAVKLRDAFKNFGEALVACAKEYQTAQENAYNAADGLPKVFYW